jgi:hypothetical protein
MFYDPNIKAASVLTTDFSKNYSLKAFNYYPNEIQIETNGKFKT